MTLIRLLGIHTQMVRPEAQASLDLAARIWAKHGWPEEPDALAEALEETLTRCVEQGIFYAPILLQRKKALERGTWKPRLAGAPPPKGAEGQCVRCGGTGSYLEAGTGYLCPCGAWRTWGRLASADQPARAGRLPATDHPSAELPKHDSAEHGALESLGQIVARAVAARGTTTGEPK
jgi:hypothetical protein